MKIAEYKQTVKDMNFKKAIIAIKKCEYKDTIFFLILGTMLMALAVNGVLAPNYLINGGISGISLMLHFAFGWNLSMLTIVLNVPIFLIALKFLPKKFLGFSILGTMLLAGWIELTKDFRIPLNSELTIVVLGGLINGLGMGMIFRTGGSTGGTDIIAKIFNKLFSFSMGSVSFMINMIIMAAAAYFFSIDLAVVTAISMFVASQATNLIVDGLNSRRTGTIIVSPEYAEEICLAITHELHRGATMVDATGGYTHNKKVIIYTMINMREVAKLKQIVSSHDKHAFMTIVETAQVIGNGKGFLSQINNK
ncbi:YitT family protein [Candidatus Epulonipiscium viviparus]|uniref:YitT family protein n=1 Tax=Candidatus Epulonipiscium viviparus TaxID=420336 RepID=UPI00016C0327|nr:YitT family protein [Candidatus Epulopiscium viviparus]